jgi:hypothetical protein
MYQGQQNDGPRVGCSSLVIYQVFYLILIILWPFYFDGKIEDKWIYAAMGVNVILLLGVIRALSYYPPGYWEGLNSIFISFMTGCSHITLIILSWMMPFIWLASVLLAISSLVMGREWASRKWFKIVSFCFHHRFRK